MFIQFSSLGYLLFSGPLFTDPVFLLIIEILGIVIGVWAIAIVIRHSKIRVQPDVHPKATLVKEGIYKWIRHPMYLAIILTVLPLLIDYFTLSRLVVFLILFVNMILKIKYEEKLLEQHFPDYQKVYAKTVRLIPFIW